MHQLKGVLSGLLLLLVLAYGGRTLLLPATWQPGWDDVAFLAALLAAAATLLVRAATAVRGRAGWLSIGVGVTLYALGFVHWSVTIRPLAVHPTPTPADALWLALYPCTALGVVLLVRDVRPRHSTAMWLDGLIAGTAAVALADALADPFETLQLSRGGIGQEVLAAYPVAQLLLLLMVVTVIVAMRLRVPPSWWWLGAGFLLLLCAEWSAVHDAATTGTFDFAGPLGLTYLLALACIALAGGRREQVPSPEPSQGPLALVVPVGALVTATALLSWSGRGPEDVLTRALAALTVLLAAARLLLSFAEINRLAASDALSVTDDLTGLQNRRGFYRRATQRLEEGGESALVLLDLDGFKEVNDTLGHAAGDRLLVAVAARLASTVRASHQARTQDVLARLGGDEFAVLLSTTGATEGTEAAARMLSHLRQPFALEEVAVHVSASAGVAQAPADGSTLDVLLRKADVAMYQAKERGGGVQRYRRETDTRSRSRLELVDRVRTALDEGRLRVHYQPKVCLVTGSVLGVEALARLEDPERGLLPPAQFLPLIQQAGLTPQLTEQVLHRALADVTRWHAEGHRIPVAVNVRADAFDDELLTPLVAAALDHHGLDGRLLVVEVTEDFLMADRPTGRQVVDQLRDLGVQLSIDDYGTGYSSLAYLRDLPIDELKLDRSFVTRMADDRRAARIVHSTVELAHGLGMRMVAEGVETPQVAALLREQGCDLAQGFLFARPVPAEQLLPVLREGFDVAASPADR